jgi:dethiobiotin synthetase
VAGERVHVFHDLRLALRRRGAADTFAERDAHAGRFALERTDDELRAIEEIEAAPVDVRQCIPGQRRQVSRVGDAVALAGDKAAGLIGEAGVEIGLAFGLDFCDGAPILRAFRTGTVASGVFVSGTDTGAGKTHASCALLEALRACGSRAVGMKPVASGCVATSAGLRNDDANLLIAASDPQPPYALCNPFALADAIAPHLAARAMHVEITPEPILNAYARLAENADHIVVEGVGGWAVPLSQTIMQADLVRALRLPVILVVGLRLGCLNHALLSVRAIREDGCELAGWIANRIDPAMAAQDENLDTLKARIDAPLLGILGHAATAAENTRALLPAIARL